MLPRSRRVSKTLFDQVFKASRTFHSAFFYMRVGWSNGAESRAAVVVSKKIDNRATRRNALRRRCYVAFRPYLENIKPNTVVLIFAKKGAEKLSKTELEKELKTLLNKAGLLGSDNLIQ